MFKAIEICYNKNHLSVIQNSNSIRYSLKVMDPHGTWQVFDGDSFDPKDLLFTVKRPNIVQLKCKLNVFLASNTSKDVWDFTMKGSFFTRSCKVYKGDSSMVIAQVSS